MRRRFYIETWGCQMNQLDTQRMNGQLMAQGLLPTRDVSEADVVLLNSCSVREKAEQKAYSRLGEYRILKRHRPDQILGFCGCVAQQEGETALRRIPELDFVLGTGRIGELSTTIDEARRGRRSVVTGFPPVPDYDFETIHRDGLHKGMVTIVEGCNKRCTFCIVPTTRGEERCRPLEDIVAEVRHLLDYGFVEIELLGQTVNHWRGRTAGGGDLDFADLLDVVAVLPGLRRLRFVTSYPRDFTQPMVDRFARHQNLSSYLHLPVQSGSNRILRRMGRGYEVEDYRRLARSLRAARPDLALSTDLIVGFPGETRSDFESTLRLVEEMRWSGVFAFKYSPRPGTAAVHLADEVATADADARLQELFALQTDIQLELNRELVGRELEVLVTGPAKNEGMVSARTDCHRVVHFAGSLSGFDTAHPVDENGRVAPSGAVFEAGALTRIVVEKAYPHSLMGRPAGGSVTSGRQDSATASPRLPVLG